VRTAASAVPPSAARRPGKPLGVSPRANPSTPLHARPTNAAPARNPNSPPPPSPREFHLKPTRQPMLWAALSYASGIVAGVHAGRPASWWITAAAAFLAPGLYFLRRRTWLGTGLALGAFFLAGALHIQLRGNANPPDPSFQPFADGQPVVMTAHVTREGRFREGAPNEVRQTLDVETEEILAENGKRIPVHSGVRLGIYSARPEQTREPAIRLFRYGERIRLPVKLKLPRNFGNPGPSTIQATSRQTASPL
jgi:hypothetical protein